MHIAIILGQGPDVDAVLAPPEPLPANVILLSANSLGPADSSLTVDVHDIKRLRRTLHAQKASEIVIIGLLRLAGSSVRRRTPGVGAVVRQAMQGQDDSDATKRQLYRQLHPEFGFLPAKPLLPFLFAPVHVSVNPAPRLLGQALTELASSSADGKLNVGGEIVKVFTAMPDEPVNLLNRCLCLAELKRLHREESVSRFFFDRERTIVVGIKAMTAYARENGLTLQSLT
jgi:hypothetical protein